MTSPSAHSSSTPAPASVPSAAPAAASVRPTVPAIHLSIDRLVIDCPAGLRAEALRAEVEHHLHLECARRAADKLPAPAPASARVAPARIRASRQPADYAARIARAVADRLWP
jgi:hypothetical protein